MSTPSALAAARSQAGGWRQDLLWAYGLRSAPAPVRSFQWRARRLARRTGDDFSLQSVTRPADLLTLLELAQGRRRVVELGTATAWTAITLALADPERSVVSYDVADDTTRAASYLQLVGADVRARIDLVRAAGSAGPRAGGARAQHPDMLYIDSSHEFDQTLAEVDAWREHLQAGAVVVFDDYTHPDYPGVRQAIEQLGLDGRVRGELFVHRHQG